MNCQIKKECSTCSMFKDGKCGVTNNLTESTFYCEAWKNRFVMLTEFA